MQTTKGSSSQFTESPRATDEENQCESPTLTRGKENTVENWEKNDDVQDAVLHFFSHNNPTKTERGVIKVPIHYKHILFSPHSSFPSFLDHHINPITVFISIIQPSPDLVHQFEADVDRFRG